MSRLNDPENFRGRVNYAVQVIAYGRRPTRAFDNCFENYDGDEVATAILRRLRKNARLAANLQRYISASPPSKRRPSGLPMFPHASWRTPHGKVAPAGRPSSMHRSTSSAKQKPSQKLTPPRHPPVDRLAETSLAPRRPLSIKLWPRDSNLSANRFSPGKEYEATDPTILVEVKQKRGVHKRSHSIWGDIDLSAVAEEAAMDAELVVLTNPRPVDSVVGLIDAEDGRNHQAEHPMADPQVAESLQSATEAPATPNPPETKKKALRPSKAKAEPKQSVRKNGAKLTSKAAETPATAVRTGRKVFSQIERSQKLTQIEKSIASGTTLKHAVGQAGISEQTYYHWKKAASPATQDSGDLKDLVALEEENKRLKNLLAERLRKENAELKKS